MIFYYSKSNFLNSVNLELLFKVNILFEWSNKKKSNYSFNKKSLAKLFLTTSIILFIPTSVSHSLFISSKNKVINKNDYLFQDSKLLGYKWIDFKPSSKIKDLESYEKFFEEYLKNKK